MHVEDKKAVELTIYKTIKHTGTNHDEDLKPVELMIFINIDVI